MSTGGIPVRLLESQRAPGSCSIIPRLPSFRGVSIADGLTRRAVCLPGLDLAALVAHTPDSPKR